MPKLYFKYGCMNSSKSANLLMIKHNYEEQGFRVLLLKPAIDTRDGEYVSSRIGISSKCKMIDANFDIYTTYVEEESDIIMVDEAQFLTSKQVEDLYELSFKKNVICFGLLTDFRKQLFEGSKRLIELAESLQEIKTVCKCGRRATNNARFDENGNLVTNGSQVDIGGNQKYRALCKECYRLYEKQAKK